MSQWHPDCQCQCQTRNAGQRAKASHTAYLLPMYAQAAFTPGTAVSQDTVTMMTTRAPALDMMPVLLMAVVVTANKREESHTMNVTLQGKFKPNDRSRSLAVPTGTP